MARASAPSWNPTSSCRTAVVRATISPSLSAKSRRETYFRQNSPIWMDRTFFRVDSLLVMHGTVFPEMSCFFQRSDPLIVIELLPFQEHELRVEEESTFFWKIVQLIVRISRPRNRRHLCPAPAKEMMVSRCSSSSPVGHGALMSVILTCGSDSIPVLLRAALYFPPLQATRAASATSALVGWVPEPELRGIRAVVQFFRQSAELCAAPPTSPFIALLMDPLAVKAQARFPHCSSVSDCTIRFLLRSGPECGWSNITDLARLPKLKSKFQFRVSVRASWHLRQQQAAAISAQHGQRLVATDDSLKAFFPRGGAARDCAASLVIDTIRFEPPLPKKKSQSGALPKCLGQLTFSNVKNNAGGGGGGPVGATFRPKGLFSGFTNASFTPKLFFLKKNFSRVFV